MDTRKPIVRQNFTWEIYRDQARARILAHPAAQEAFNRLARHGVDRERLLDRLIVLGMVARRHAHAAEKRNSWKERCGAPANMTWAQFLSFVRSCKKMAIRIQTINDFSYYDPRLWLASIPTRNHAQRRDLVGELKVVRTDHNRLRVKKAFLELPSVLLRYTDFLEIAAKEIREWLFSLGTESADTPTQYRDDLVQ